MPFRNGSSIRLSSQITVPKMRESSDNREHAIRFVEVALPLPPRRTFTYRLPVDLSKKARLGLRVLVPFSSRMLTGYIVALHAELDPELEIDEASLKEVA